MDDSVVTEKADGAPDKAAPSGALPQAAPSGVAPGEPVRPPETFAPGTFVETPLGAGVVRNVARTRGRITAVIVRLDDDEDVDRAWRVFDPDDVALR